MDGEDVIVNVEVGWADKQHRGLRVRATASGPSTWLTERLEESLVIRPRSGPAKHL